MGKREMGQRRDNNYEVLFLRRDLRAKSGMLADNGLKAAQALHQI